jgi:pimeloyl-ACP methyl ester carboxylesterase
MQSLKAILRCVVILCAHSTLAWGQTPRIVAANGHHLAFYVTPGRLPALVLDAGGGADSTYWKSIIPALVKRTGSEIITYDRAGFGSSDETKPPYRMQDAVDDLASSLQQVGATRDLILIPHSFAGEIATYLALTHPDWISGAILVDTNVPDFFTDEEVGHLDPIVRPMIAAELAAHPSKRTRTLEAIEEAYLPTSSAFHKVAWPAAIPCDVIVSEATPFPPQLKADSQRWTQAHMAFADRAPNRVLIVAKASSHDIVHDRPEIIVDAAGQMVDRIRAGKPAVSQ